jgi:hypothetical protein
MREGKFVRFARCICLRGKPLTAKWQSFGIHCKSQENSVCSDMKSVTFAPLRS